MFNEPHADIRNMAATVRQMYNAFQMEGFDHDDSLDLTKLMFTTASGTPQR